MWCRTILTAVAISYVICMLLWSGLQKEDLDASTLEKLSRYNVNIGDLNNEQRRQQCLLNQITTEVQREALRTSAPERLENDVTVGIYPKIGMLLAAKFEDKTVHGNDTKTHFEELRLNAEKKSDVGTVTNEGNKAIIKIEYNVQNQPDVESVMNFWTKFSHRTSTVATIPTTLADRVTKIVHVDNLRVKNDTETAQTDTQNDGYVHSREMEYISRILAEYLVSQTIPTTTEKASTEKIFSSYVPTKFWEVSNKTAVKEEPIVEYEQGNEINKINTTQDKSHSDKVIDNSIVDEGKTEPFKVTFDNQLMQMIRDTPSSQYEPKVKESKPVERSNTKGIIHRLLRMKNDLFNNGFAFPESEFETKTINKSNENKGETKSFKLFKLFQHMNDANNNNSYNVMMNDDQCINATIKAETMAKPEPEVRLTDIKKSKVHQNLNLDQTGSRFRAMLPSIKYSKQIKNVQNVNNAIIGTTAVFTKSEGHENDAVESFIVKKAVVNQQPAAIEKFAKNQLFKMKNDTFTADTETTSNIKKETEKLNGKLLKKAPVFQNMEPTNNDSERLKAIKEILNEYDQENKQLTVKGLTPTKNVDSMNASDFQAIPASIITDIAEQVKRMVLKDIGENITSTSTTITEGTTLSTTTIHTTEPPPMSLQTEFTQSSQVMKKLMEIFKELNAMKDTAKLISQMPQNVSNVRSVTTVVPQSRNQPNAPASLNPYLMQNPPNFMPIQASSYSSKVQTPSGVNPQYKTPLYLTPLNAQSTNDYHFGAITIQTNSDEIAPLPIQMPKPSKLMNQHIVLTTKRTQDTIKKERERESMRHVEEKFRIPNENRNHRDKLEEVSELPKNVRFAEKHEVRDRYSYRGGYLDREKPLYHEYHEKVHNIEQPVRSRFPELRYPGRLAHLEHSGRPRDLSTSEDSNPPRVYNRPGFNEPGRHKSGIKHHPRPYSHTARGRQPRFETTKFHEKLERYENWPRSTWKDFHTPSDSSNDEISARQQLPLVKVKKRVRYDDSHFTNFLKSQQKVTDMLEKILTNNLKNSKSHSVETP